MSSNDVAQIWPVVLPVVAGGVNCVCVCVVEAGGGGRAPV